MLFDFDGTLADSAPTVLGAARAALTEWERPIPPEPQLRRFVGPPIMTGITQVLGIEPERARAFLATYRSHYLTTLTQAELFDGAVQTLDRLARAGWTLAVASSKREDMVVRILEHHALAERFAVIAGADDAGTRPDKESVIRAALDGLGADPRGDCLVMVGDRHHDVDGAAALGIPAVFAAWGYGTPDEAAGAAASAASLEQLAHLLTDTRPPLPCVGAPVPQTGHDEQQMGTHS